MEPASSIAFVNADVGRSHHPDDLDKIVYGAGTRGCRFCGSVSRKVSENGRVAWYHPGTECCANALTQQIAWRQSEIEGVNAEIEGHMRVIADLRTTAETADLPPRQSQSISDRARRAQDGLDRRRRDYYTPKIRSLAAEIERLKRRRAALNDPRGGGPG